MRLSPLNARALTAAVWPCSVFSSLPVEGSHNLMALSPAPEAIRLPSLLQATVLMTEAWPGIVNSSLPLSTLQIFTKRSEEPLTIFVPSGLKAAEVTAPLWPVKVLSNSYFFASHNLSVLSPLHERMYSPLGL